MEAMPFQKLVSSMHECSVDAWKKVRAVATTRLSAHVRGARAHAVRSAAELRAHHAWTVCSCVSHAVAAILSPCTWCKYAAAMVVSTSSAAQREHNVRHCAPLQGTKGTQRSPLRSTASRGCPGACRACRSTTT